MRISKGEYAAEIEKISSGEQAASRFRYVLHHLVDKEIGRLYSSKLYRSMRTCVTHADRHLDRMARRRGLIIGVLGPYIAQEGRMEVMARRSMITMPRRRADSSAA